MSRRIYQMMKFFAILVFSFEMLAPAFVPSVAYKKETATRIINATNTAQSQLYCLIAEEFGFNEEDGLDNKEFVPLFDFDILAIFDVRFVESSAKSFAFTQQISNGAAQRPLFLLHRLLLI